MLQPHQDTLLQPYAETSQNSCFPPMTFPQWVPMVEQPTLDTYQPMGLMLPEDTGGCNGIGSGSGCGNAIMGWEQARVAPGMVIQCWSSPAAGAMPPPCHLTEGTVPMQYAAEATPFVPAVSPVPRLLLDSTGESYQLLIAINCY